jgi:hypothetical protein
MVESYGIGFIQLFIYVIAEGASIRNIDTDSIGKIWLLIELEDIHKRAVSYLIKMNTIVVERSELG